MVGFYTTIKTIGLQSDGLSWFGGNRLFNSLDLILVLAVLFSKLYNGRFLHHSSATGLQFDALSWCGSGYTIVHVILSFIGWIQCQFKSSTSYELYLGPKSALTLTAQQMMELVFKRFAEVKLLCCYCKSRKVPTHLFQIIPLGPVINSIHV